MHFHRLLHWGPIIALLIIAFLFFVSTVTILSWWYPSDWASILHAVIFYSWVVNILRNFVKAAFLGPGHLSFRWKPAKKEDVWKLQFCEPCQGFKAPRTHHCRICKRCILKMDHHCPWINNCVGHHNHKSFALFLLFVVAGCTHSALIMCFCIFDNLVWVNGHILLKYDRLSPIPLGSGLMLSLFFGVGLSLGVVIAVSFLLYHQIKSILKNETGIESWIVEKAARRKRGEGEAFVYPYDLGVWANTKQVLNWSHDFIGDGVTWDVFEGCDQYTLTVEQLEQKELKRENTIPYISHSAYSGSCFPYGYGWKVCYDSPWTDELRLPMQIGDVLLATRWKEHWVYGERQEAKQTEGTHILGEEVLIKGWVPRCCLKELYGDLHDGDEIRPLVETVDRKKVN